jgi:hypothetical protein
VVCSLLLTCVLAQNDPAGWAPVPKPGAYIPQAHSHNDYEQDRPFALAYENGFASVEADVYLVEGELLVAHDRKDLRPERTLKSLYLEPIRWACKRNGGWLYSPGMQMTLMVDIKADGAEAWKVLRQQAMQYSDVIWPKGRGPVRIVVSGDRPRSLILGDKPNWTSMDGRKEDLDLIVDGISMISEDWRRHFANVGLTPLSPDEQKKLKEWTGRAHARSRIVRFWGTPENERMWSTLLENGVDLIGTDQPAKLAAYLKERNIRNPKFRSYVP